MPSIFIWKANTPNTSKKSIRFYSGSNWVLEDNDYSSKSYIYLEQIVISESDNSVITFHSKDMPQDWVGSELLEVSNIPYELVKSDNYGTLEMIGDWMRFTSKSETDFTETFLKTEFSSIKKWMNNKNKQVEQKKVTKNYQSQKTNSILDPNLVKINFEEFLIKYNIHNSISQITQNPTNTYNNHNKFNKSNVNTSKYNNKKTHK